MSIFFCSDIAFFEENDRTYEQATNKLAFTSFALSLFLLAIFFGRHTALAFEELREILHVEDSAVQCNSLYLQTRGTQKMCGVFYATLSYVLGDGL